MRNLVSFIIIIIIIILFSPVARRFFMLLVLDQQWSPPLRLQVSDCSTFRITCDVPSTSVFVVNLLYVYLVWIPNFLQAFFHHSGSSNYYYRYKHTFHIPHSFLSPYINSCILASFPLPFVWHCPQVVPHLSVCMFSLFWFVIVISGLLVITSLSLCMYPLNS